jgi:hypothetical protein
MPKQTARNASNHSNYCLGNYSCASLHPCKTIISEYGVFCSFRTTKFMYGFIGMDMHSNRRRSNWKSTKCKLQDVFGVPWSRGGVHQSWMLREARLFKLVTQPSPMDAVASPYHPKVATDVVIASTRKSIPRYSRQMSSLVYSIFHILENMCKFLYESEGYIRYTSIWNTIQIFWKLNVRCWIQNNNLIEIHNTLSEVHNFFFHNFEHLERSTYICFKGSTTAFSFRTFWALSHMWGQQ